MTFLLPILVTTGLPTALKRLQRVCPSDALCLEPRRPETRHIRRYWRRIPSVCVRVCKCVCQMRVSPKQKIFYKSQGRPIGYGLSCSRERQLPGNSRVSAEVIPRWVIRSRVARNKGRKEKKEGKKSDCPVHKEESSPAGSNTSPVTLDRDALQSHRQMSRRITGVTFFMLHF